jgi:hypothetical protein
LCLRGVGKFLEDLLGDLGDIVGRLFGGIWQVFGRVLEGF